MDMMTLLLARAMAGGGSGFAAQSDWNAAEGEPGHVLNRTHYEENIETEFLPETELTGEGGLFTIEGELPFVIDQTYAVYFNGTRYECKCYSITYEGIVMTGVGNSAILGMPGAVDTGEPFTVGVVPAMQPGVTLVIDSAGGTNCTVAISAVEKVVHKIPNKYIDAEWMAKETMVEKTLFSQSDITFTLGLPIAVDFDMPTAGNQYTVTFDGVDYVCTLVDYNNLGNLYIMGNGKYVDDVDTGEPFLFVWSDGNKVVYSDPGTHTIQVKEKVTETPTIPEKYLPETVATKEYVDTAILGAIGGSY